MTSGKQRPGDAARRALREARQRAEAGRAGAERTEAGWDETWRETAASEDAVERAGADRPRPADAARAALRSAMSAAPDGPDADGTSAGTGDSAGAGAGDTPAASSPSDAEAGPAATAPPDGAADGRDVPGPARADEWGVPRRPDGVGGRGVPRSARADGPEASESSRAERSAGRPADVAREALRSARREALRAEAEAEEAAARGAAQPRPRSGPRGSASTAPRTAPADSRAARSEAAQDMRRYLATAFRMPEWSDAPEEETNPDGADTDGSAGPRPAVASPRTPQATSAAGPDHASEGSASLRRPPATTSAGPNQASTEPVSPRGPHTAGSVDPARTSAEPVSSRRPPATRISPAAPCVPGTPTESGAIPAAGSASPHTPPDPGAPAPARRPGTTHRDGPRSAAPASPHVPPTMATPHRDTELRRTFPAFPPREAGDVAFAATWWGNAWTGALEQGALDPKRLARGRGYADQGHVDAITVTPGLVLAYVRGSRPRPYRVQVRVRTLEDADWARFLDAAADRPGHIAALLDKELPQSLADCGVPLLPGPGDLVPRCSCPDSGHPCKHAAALCYQTARLLDADPFVLLLLRGRGEKDLLDALSRRSAARAARAAQDRGPGSLPGVRAADALAPRGLPPLPPPLPVPPHPEQPPVYPAAPGGPDPFALDQLATDAAARAHALLGTARDPVGELTLWQDAVRLAAARPGSGLTATTRTLYATLAAATGRTPADLARAVAAWRQGGLAGLAVLEEAWDPPAGRFDRARPSLLAADLPAFRPWRNRLTHPRGHVQLRLGRDGLWYAYESEPERDDWWPRGTPDLDPVGALTGLGTLDDA
ncbi:SWIM zinc finger family protein [Streptomyces sp. NPDC052109]|uniref:SWIM zinc finger family protein n=1 Tax=Streptomyces sp. NPDC052109 TaxID=3155527 RepID=UPI003448274C